MNNRHVKTLMYTTSFFVGVLTLLAVVGTVSLVRGNQDHNTNTISVSGTGELSAAPDIATFSFSVNETEKTAEAAQKKINEKVSKILDGLDDLDVDEKDIKTESYTIYPKYEYVRLADNEVKESLDGELYYPGHNNRKQVQVGFDVRQNVRVKIRDLDTVSEALTLFASNEVKNLNGPNFEIDDPEALKEEARSIAIKDARAQAKRLSKDLGVKLGDIVSFNENSYTPQPYFRGGAMMAKSASFAEDADFAPELPVGENDIRATVNVIFEIK